MSNMKNVLWPSTFSENTKYIYTQQPRRCSSTSSRGRSIRQRRLTLLVILARFVLSLPRLSFVMLQMFPSSNFHVRHEKRTLTFNFLWEYEIYIHSTAEELQKSFVIPKMRKKQKAGPSGATTTAPTKSPKANNNQPGNTRCCFLLSDYLCHR